MNDLVSAPLPAAAPAARRFPRVVARTVHAVFAWAVLLAAAAFVVLYLWIMGRRIGYPYDIEWMEGAIIDHVRYVMLHGNVYVKPSQEFTPYLYHPLFYWLAALSSLVFGLDYFAVRLISVLASFGCFALLYRFVQRDTGSHRGGVVAAGLFAATFPLSGGFFDLARVDVLGLAFCLACFYAVRVARTKREYIIAGALGALAFATKQSTLLILPGLCLYIWWARGFRRAFWFGLTAGLLCAALMLVLHLTSHGWYWFYAAVIPSKHTSDYKADFWRNEFLGPLFLAVAFGFKYLFDDNSDTETRVFHAVVVFTLLLLAHVTRGHVGSYINDSMPAHAAAALMGGLGAARFLSFWGARQTPFAMVACLVMLAQFALLRYEPEPMVPTPAAHQAVQQLREKIRSLPGDVFIPDHGHIGPREGKPMHAHSIAIWDVTRAFEKEPNGLGAELQEQYNRSFRERRFGALLFDRDGADLINPGLVARYYSASPEPSVPDPGKLMPRSGLMVVPSRVWLPRK